MVFKDITFVEYVQIIKAYFKEEKNYIKSLFVSHFHLGQRHGENKKSKRNLQKEERETKEKIRNLQKELTTYKFFYAFKEVVKHNNFNAIDFHFSNIGFNFCKKIVPRVADLVRNIIEENLKDFPEPDELPTIKIERCNDCLVFYDVPFGHQCLWQRTRSGELEVPDILQKDGEPVYINSSHFEEEQIDLMLDKFCEYRSLEDQLPQSFRKKTEELRTSRAIRACIVYWWKTYSRVSAPIFMLRIVRAC
jgi:hypothetical protein